MHHVGRHVAAHARWKSKRILAVVSLSFGVARRRRIHCSQGKKLRKKTFKGPCSPNLLCALMFLFWNGSIVQCRVMIGWHVDFSIIRPGEQSILDEHGPLIWALIYHVLSAAHHMVYATLDCLFFKVLPLFSLRVTGAGRVRWTTF